MTSAVVRALAKTSLTVVNDATCTRCGCLCDDINLSIRENRIVAAEHACSLGEHWFFDQRQAEGAACWVDGKPASLDAGIDRAVEILRAAKYPLVYGLQHASCEAQRVAVQIADGLGGTIDTPTSSQLGPAGTSFQGVGEVTCTLGEISNRADFLLFWGSNPAETHPRFFERYGLEPEGLFVPVGRNGRYAALVDASKTETAAAMDEFVQIAPGRDFEALWTLRAITQGRELHAEQVLQATGVALTCWQALMARMKAAKFGAILFDSHRMQQSGGHLSADATWALVKEMNDYTRFVGRPMRGGGNPAGADNVLTWQTGYPFGVNFARGYPRFCPGEFTANEMLVRGEVDAALVVGCDPEKSLEPAACKRLATLPRIVIGPHALNLPTDAKVIFSTATYGVEAPATVYRMDDVPLLTRPAVTSELSSDFEILAEIQRRIEGV